MATQTITLHKNTAYDFAARFLPGGAEQDIATSLIEAFFVENANSDPILTLSSADVSEIEKLTADSQASTAVTSVASNIIEAAGALFVSAEVLPDESVAFDAVPNSTNSPYTVKRVISETKLETNETLTDETVPTASIIVTRGLGWFRVKIDIADVNSLTFSSGMLFLYLTPSGGEREFIGKFCLQIEDAPS